MSEYNVSGHFVRPGRRMCGPQSQIVLGHCKSDAPAAVTGRQLNDAQKLSVAAATKRSQLESAMWAGDSAAPSPSTRRRIEEVDNKMLLGGCNRRYAGVSNRSNPDDLFCEPGKNQQRSGSADSLRRGRAGVRAAGTNSFEMAHSEVGRSIVGAIMPAAPEDHARGVRKLDEGRDHIDHRAVPLPTPKRERTPPPPLPERKGHKGIRRVESPLRGDVCSEPWARWGERQEFHRASGTRFFPERSCTPTEVLPFVDIRSKQQKEKQQQQKTSSNNILPADENVVNIAYGSARRDIRPTSALNKHYKPDPTAASSTARASRFTPQRDRAPSPFSAKGITKKELLAEQQQRGVPLTGSVARRQHNDSQINTSGAGTPMDVRYVPRKHMVAGASPSRPAFRA